jgi:phage terminase large subunit-like protein
VTAHGIVTHNTFGGGGYELGCHLTGIYPHWWEGRRFTTPISAWAAGDTYETTRDIIQLTLLGEVDYRGARKVMDGRGVIPGRLLGDPTWRNGVQNLIDTIPVRHVSGGWSQLGLKSYDQGRRIFQGTGKHVIWLDEEPPMDVYNECLIRTATLDGIIMLTFTPLLGLSEVVMSFLPADQRPDLSA